jgi:hypothetical protein
MKNLRILVATLLIKKLRIIHRKGYLHEHVGGDIPGSLHEKIAY